MSEIVILSLKTAGTIDKRTILDAEVDMQGMSEMWTHEPDLPEDETFWGVQMVHLLKGYRKADTSANSRGYITMSPLTTGYRKNDIGGWTYSPKYVSPRGWERFFVWEEMGSEAWIETLASGDHHPTRDDSPILDSLVHMPPLIYRKPQATRLWQLQTSQAEILFHSDLKAAAYSPEGPEIFERHLRSCVWPTRCQFFDGCHGAADFSDPSQFVPREPHHGPEAGQEIEGHQELLRLANGREIVWLDRSRVLQRQRCPWSRYLEYHWQGGLGIRRKSIAIPLATGIVTHIGVGAILEGKSLREAIGLAHQEYDRIVRDFGLREDEWGPEGEPMTQEAQPFVVQEQRCLTEGLIRVAARLAIPPLLEWYEVMSVERERWRILGETAEAIFVWQARADAILKRKGT